MRQQFLAEKKIINANNDWKPKNDRIYGLIIKIENDAIFIQFFDKLEKFADVTHVDPSEEKYFLRFMTDRTTIALEHRALDIMYRHNIAGFFFPLKGPETADIKYANNKIE